jgi:hypothetical protein
MREKKYRVILEIPAEKGRDQTQVIRRLAKAFKRDEDFMRKLLSRGPVPVKKAVDLNTAKRHQMALTKLGAIGRIEQEPEEDQGREEPGPHGKVVDKTPAGRVPSCPQCGYTPGRDGDIGITHGECPRCGFVAKKDRAAATGSTSQTLRRLDELSMDVLAREAAYASWGKRFLATLSTWSLFMSIHMIVLVIVVIAIFPSQKLWILLGKQFLGSLIAVYPAFISILSLFIVMVLIPMLNEGRTLGQRWAGIRLKSLREGTPDKYMQITMRVLAVVFLTYLPGIFLIFLSGLVGIYTSFNDKIRIIVICAIIAWSINWLVSLFNDQGRGFVDICSQVIQENEREIDSYDVGLALAPFIFVIFMLLVFGLFIPLS